MPRRAKIYRRVPRHFRLFVVSGMVTWKLMNLSIMTIASSVVPAPVRYPDLFTIFRWSPACPNEVSWYKFPSPLTVVAGLTITPGALKHGRAVSGMH